MLDLCQAGSRCLTPAVQARLLSISFPLKAGLLQLELGVTGGGGALGLVARGGA